MNEKIYDIDYQKLIRWLTPKIMWQPIWLNVMGVLTFPIVGIYQAFLLFRTAKIYQLMITPQVCYLERLLNDRYDFSGRRIYISDGIDHPPTYIYVTDELKPLYLGTQTIYTSGESGDLKDDFIIFVPATLPFEDLEMISLVKNYKLAGTKFKIQRF